MGMVGAQTRLPCPRTDQYFSSDGTKHLVEQLLLKSFTHSMGTPPNTLSRRACACVCVCLRKSAIEGIWGPSELLLRWQQGEVRASRSCMVWEWVAYFSSMFCVFFCSHCVLYPHVFSLSVALPPRHTHFELVPHDYSIGRPKGVGQRGIETLTERKRDSVLYFVVPTFTLLNLKSGSASPSFSAWCGLRSPHPSPIVMHLERSQSAPAVCLWGISERTLKMSGYQHPGDKLRFLAGKRWDLESSKARDECEIYWSQGPGLEHQRHRSEKPRNWKCGNQLWRFCWFGAFYFLKKKK